MLVFSSRRRHTRLTCDWSQTCALPIYPKLLRIIGKRREELDDDRVDWSLAEALAFGSLLLEGTPVRLAGQDTRQIGRASCRERASSSDVLAAGAGVQRVLYKRASLTVV